MSISPILTRTTSCSELGRGALALPRLAPIPGQDEEGETAPQSTWGNYTACFRVSAAAAWFGARAMISAISGETWSGRGSGIPVSCAASTKSASLSSRVDPALPDPIRARPIPGLPPPISNPSPALPEKAQGRRSPSPPALRPSALRSRSQAAAVSRPGFISASAPSRVGLHGAGPAVRSPWPRLAVARAISAAIVGV